MLWALVLVPLVGSALAFAVPSNRHRPKIVPAVAVLHVALVVAVLIRGGTAHGTGAWLGLDPLNRLVLVNVSGVYLLCALYAPIYLRVRAERDNRVFTGVVLAFLGTMSLAVLARHLGLMWVGLEASTLSVAPLLYFNHNRRSIEATWKYLLIGAVGIALALLGSFFLAYSSFYSQLDSTLFFDDLGVDAAHLSKPWLRAALVLLIIGYGTKMGLAPMHTWKPDAYGEAPGIVGTLLAGALTSCAFLAILRAFHIAVLAGEADFARQLFITLGLVSMAVAAVFMVRQDDFKRMLAYSSVEHMGILVLGIGIGGVGVFGALFHMLTNAFTKGALFLSAGNIHRTYRSKLASEVQGAFVRTPVSAALFVTGFFAVTGAPPFGPFFSELTILQAAISQDRMWMAGAFLLFLLVVFVGMGTTVLQVVQGEPPEGHAGPSDQDGLANAMPIVAFLAVSLVLGVWLPPPVYDLLEQAAAYVEGEIPIGGAP